MIIQHNPSPPPLTLRGGYYFLPLGIRGIKGMLRSINLPVGHDILPHIMDTHLLAQELEKINFIDFAFLFGSFAERRATRVSDIEIGIYTSRDITLLEIGEIVARLEKITTLKVDLIILNDLCKKKPVLSFEIVSNGHLLLCRDMEKLTAFKKDTFLSYLDTAPLRHAVDQRFRERITTNRAGERNYAGTA